MFTAKPSHPTLTLLSLKLNRTSKEKKQTKQKKTSKKKIECAIRNREETLLRHVAMVAKLLDHNKPRSCKYGRKKKMICVNFGGMIALMIRNRTAAHRLFVSRWKMKMTVRLYQERLSRFRNFASMVTWRFSFL